MDDQQQAAVPSADEQGQVSPTEQTSEQVSDQTQASESTQESTDDNQGEHINNSSEEEKEPTRKEKRISKLERQKEGIDNLLSQLKGPAQNQGQEDQKPIISQQDYESGIDPQELERRIMEREEQARNKSVRDAVSFMDYRDQVKDFKRDVEDTMKSPELDPTSDEYDEALDDLVSSQFESMNSVYDPYTGQTSFVPKVKMSELLAKQKAVIERRTTRATANMETRLRDQSSDNDLVPGTQPTKSEPSLDELRSQMRSNPGKVADELRKKLKYSED